jgi:N-acetyl-gamma-glutamyl-phosphate reductase
VGFELARRGVKVVDLGSDYRMDTPERYEEAYGSPHPRPDALTDWVYGLPEFFRAEITGAERVAAPGCYPTASLLAVAPLVAGGLVDPTALTINALSGASGAGRSMREDLLFGAVDQGVRAYGVAKHRHRPEIEMGLELVAGERALVTFTPHLVPMQRGILATITAPVAGGADGGSLRAALEDAYANEPFVEAIGRPPQTRWTVGSNRALVAAFLDERTGTAIVMAAIDNLLKGAAGQAVQAANLMLGLDETAGLPSSGLMA